MCPADTVVASWSLTQEMIGLNPFYCNANTFVSEFSESKENVERKVNYSSIFIFKTNTCCLSGETIYKAFPISKLDSEIGRKNSGGKGQNIYILNM